MEVWNAQREVKKWQVSKEVKHRKLKGYVFLAFKDEDGEWEDVCLRYPVRKQDLEAALRDKDTRRVDSYFCPTVFSKRRRKREFANPSLWLHADLDAVEPASCEPTPTQAWESSRGRFQCLWRLQRPLSVESWHKLNSRLTYATGADKGGWSITKVLRIPDTFNQKYEGSQLVRLLWDEGRVYTGREVLGYVEDVEAPAYDVSQDALDIPDMTADAVMHKHKGSLPKHVRRLLGAKQAVRGERSHRLWELECALLEAGLPKGEALILVKSTVWNKYAGQRRETAQLWRELSKAEAHVKGVAGRGKNSVALKHAAQDGGSNSLEQADDSELVLEGVGDFLDRPIPLVPWTVEGIWSNKAHGLIAGEAKSYKSMFASDLAVSVASGTPFLDRYPVSEKGPVIYIQEENTPALMQDRFQKLYHSRGLLGSAAVRNGTLRLKPTADLPIHLLNNRSFNLTDEEHMEWLDERMTKLKPKLLILDPLYLVAPGIDENSQAAVAPIMTDLIHLKNRHGCGVLIVHHYNKPWQEETRSAGHRISGTNVFYRWFESALYVEKGKKPGIVKVTPEHRGAPPGHAVQVEFDMGELGDLYYHVDLEVKAEQISGLRTKLIDLVSENEGISINRAAEELGVSRDRLKNAVDRSDELRLRPQKKAHRGGSGRPARGIYLTKD